MRKSVTKRRKMVQKEHGFTPEDYPHIENNAKTLTTNQGTPVKDNSRSLTAGPRGPVLLEDYALLEKMAQFDRERIPERVFHARGAAAKGYFELTADLSDLTDAKFLNGVGKKTPVAVRFSTATNEKGSPESLRDVRGFAVKFYTEDGNWDLTGNNLPVFFIRDGYQFPDMVHALRPNPKNNIQEGWRILDWFSAHPEGLNLFTYLLGDEGIPSNWRTMDGFGVNTFIMYKGDKEVYVKFNWKSKAEGPQYFKTDKDAQMAGENNMRHVHATHDLYNHIGSGKSADWDFYIQVMDKEEGDSGKFGFDPLDCTKNWDEEQFPWKSIGKMVLDTPVSSFHNESEQIAFSPGSIVPGLALSNDKILQTRAFSYSDAHRYRLGVNYLTLPINAPKNQMHANNEAGVLNPLQKNEQVNYWPSNVEGKQDEKEASTYSVARENVPNGKKEKSDYGNLIIGDDFKQPGDRIRAMKQESRDNLKHHLCAWIGDPKNTERVANIWFDFLSKADQDFGKEVKEAVLEENGGKFGNPDSVPCSMA